MTTSASARRSTSRRIVFWVILVLLPFGLLILTELALRALGYGQDYPLFIDAPGQPGYLTMNPNVSEKYFTTVENATLGNQELFLKEKSDRTFRVFVLGASTGLGYPYLHNGSFHRWLRYRLMRTYPNTDFEIINVSLTAVTTYTLLDFARQLTNYQPDAVLIYAGHNEYYGTLGVGSTSRLGGIPLGGIPLGDNPTLVRAMIGLRDFRLMQLINDAMAGLRKGFSGTPDLRTNLMQRLAAEQSIPYGSELYERGIAQYRANLNDLLAHLNEQEVPVLLSNLVSNQKDLPPFISDTTDSERSAAFHYQRGQQAYGAGNYDEAKANFVQAKELDLLRFRAPEAMNAIVNELVDQYANVHAVDAQAVFAQHSPHSIVGEETLLEHVHPNLYGYGLLSEAFYQTLQETQLVPGTAEDTLSWEELRTQMPVTIVDSLRGAYETMMLKEGWPFNQPVPPIEERVKTTEEALAGQLVVQQISWDEAMQQLLRHYVQTNQSTEAMQVAEALVLEHPYQAELYQQAGKLAIATEQDTRGIRYLERSFALSPDPKTAQTLFVALLTRDRPTKALPYLDYAAQTNPRFAELKSFAQRIIQLKEAYQRDSTRTDLLPQIAATYLRFANTEAARKYADLALAKIPEDPVVLKLQQQLAKLENKKK